MQPTLAVSTALLPCLPACLATLLLCVIILQACTARLTVVRASDGALLNGAVVNGMWYSVNGRTGWPYPTSATTGGTGITGVASTTSNSLPGRRGNGCSFTVTSVQLGGYVLSSSAPLNSPTASW